MMMSSVCKAGLNLLTTRQAFSRSVRFARKRARLDPEKFPGRRSAVVTDTYADGDMTDQLLEIEDLMSEMGDSGASMQKIHHMEAQRNRQWLKHKILEKKHFKKEQEVNLLTWSAKAQIRYLNEQFPEEWTPERLAQSFPVSQEGVIRLLQSSWVPRNEAERIRHDLRVHKRWKTLAKAEQSNDGPMNPLLQQLLESQRLGQMKNAQGIAALPSPSENVPAVSEKSARDKQTVPGVGPFSSILLEVQPKMKRQPLPSSQVRMLEDAESLLKKFRMLELQQDMSARNEAADVCVREEVLDVSVGGDREGGGRRQPQLQSEQWGRTEGEVKETSLKPSRRARRAGKLSRGVEETVSPAALLRRQMEGTHKIPADGGKKNSEGER